MRENYTAATRKTEECRHVAADLFKEPHYHMKGEECSVLTYPQTVGAGF